MSLHLFSTIHGIEPPRRSRYAKKPPPPTRESEQAIRLREIQEVFDIDDVNRVFMTLKKEDRELMKKIHNFMPRCTRCQKFYRELYNMGQLECPIKQHLFSSPNRVTGKYLCCKRKSGDMGCLRADHIPTYGGYFKKDIVAQLPMSYFKAFVLMAYRECPEKSLFTPNVIVAVDVVLIQRLEPRAYDMLDTIIDRQTWLELAPQLRFDLADYEKQQAEEDELDWSENEEEKNEGLIDPYEKAVESRKELNWD